LLTKNLRVIVQSTGVYISFNVERFKTGGEIMKHLLKILIGSCMIVALVAFFPKTAAASGAASNILIGATATSEDDVWAVGEFLNGVGSQTLIEHWNGSKWKVVPSPNPAGAQFSVLEGVAAVSGDDAWAVGGFVPQGQTLIERWNGSKWKIVPSPNPAGAISSFFNSVSVVSEDDAWAVGATEDSSGILHTLIEHLDHDTWVIVNSPSPGPQSNFLQGVSAVSENDVWAVGDFVDSSNTEQTLIEHWNGSVWTVVPSSTPVHGVLNGVAAVSKTSVWAVGSNGAFETLTERWNGTSWNVVTSPNPLGNRFSRFTAVTVAAKKNVWAVGDYVNSAGSELTLTEHWNGSAWSIISSPNPAGATSSALNGAAAVPHEADDEDGGVWAVGGDTLNGASFTLIEHWNGVKWRIVHSPTP